MRSVASAAVGKQQAHEASSSQEQREAHGLAASIERHPMRAFVVLSAIYFLVVFTLSSLKLLWLDELITVHLARLGGLAGIWHALERGADPNPPITYVLVEWSRKLFGDHEFADRIPAAFGYWVGILSLFFYLKQRLRASWAIFGCIVSMAMGAFDYSYESRSYAIFYGLAMLAFLCWSIQADAAKSRATRWIALAGMVFALAAGVSTNYFAVLAFLPPAVGEVALIMVRVRRHRLGSADEHGTWTFPGRFRILPAVNVRVWIGFAIAATPLLIYRPLILHSIAQFSPYAWNKVSLDQVFDSYTEMVEVILWPILALMMVGAFVFALKSRVRSVCDKCRTKLLPSWAEAMMTPDRARAFIPAYEAAGIFVFLTYPICGYIIASIRGGMLSPRFVIPVCFGFAITAAVIAQYLFRKMPRTATVAICLACAWFFCREAVVGYWYMEQKQSFYRIVDAVDTAETAMPQGSPIVIPDPLLALTFRHYAPPELANRVDFPIDFPALRYFRHDDSPEENLWAGRGFLYQMPVMPLAQFQQSTGKYLIVAAPRNWLLEDLRKHRYRFARVPMDTGADSIGGFTPLAHGKPELYLTGGDRAPMGRFSTSDAPAPFKLSSNLPQAKWYAPPELLKDE